MNVVCRFPALRHVIFAWHFPCPASSKPVFCKKKHPKAKYAQEMRQMRSNCTKRRALYMGCYRWGLHTSPMRSIPEHRSCSEAYSVVQKNTKKSETCQKVRSAQCSTTRTVFFFNLWYRRINPELESHFIFCTFFSPQGQRLLSVDGFSNKNASIENVTCQPRQEGCPLRRTTSRTQCSSFSGPCGSSQYLFHRCITGYLPPSWAPCPPRPINYLLIVLLISWRMNITFKIVAVRVFFPPRTFDFCGE